CGITCQHGPTEHRLRLGAAADHVVRPGDATGHRSLLTGGGADDEVADPNVRPVKSRPWSTGPCCVPPLITLVTDPSPVRTWLACSHHWPSARPNSASAP